MLTEISLFFFPNDPQAISKTFRVCTVPFQAASYLMLRWTLFFEVRICQILKGLSLKLYSCVVSFSHQEFLGQKEARKGAETRGRSEGLQSSVSALYQATKHHIAAHSLSLGWGDIGKGEGVNSSWVEIRMVQETQKLCTWACSSALSTLGEKFQTCTTQLLWRKFNLIPAKTSTQNHSWFILKFYRQYALLKARIFSMQTSLEQSVWSKNALVSHC